MRTLFGAIVGVGFLMVVVPAGPAAGACANASGCAVAIARPTDAVPVPLDVNTLETRLRTTRAVGPFTKLALKYEVDDLLDRLREFHDGRGAGSLGHLRKRFDGLVLRVVSLLAERDRPLAVDLTASREALWRLLADPRTFSMLRARSRAGA